MFMTSYTNVLSPLLQQDSTGALACCQYVRTLSVLGQTTDNAKLKELVRPFVLLDLRLIYDLDLFHVTFAPLLNFDYCILNTKDLLTSMNEGDLSKKDPYFKQIVLHWIRSVSFLFTSTFQAVPLWVDLGAKITGVGITASSLNPTLLLLCYQSQKIALILELVFGIMEITALLESDGNGGSYTFNCSIVDYEEELLRRIYHIGRAILLCVIVFAPLSPLHRAMLEVSLASWQIFKWRFRYILKPLLGLER